MKNRLKIAALIGFGLILGLLLSQMFWMEVFARPGLDHACRALNSSASDAAHLANCINNSTRWATWLGVAVNIVTAGFVYNGFRQSERTQHMEYRAYINLEIGEVRSEGTHGFFIPVILINYGRTPATIRELYIEVPLFVPDGNRTVDKFNLSITYMPGGNTERREEAFGVINIPDNTGDEFIFGIQFFVQARCTYEDVFGRVETVRQVVALNCARHTSGNGFDVRNFP